MGVFKLWWALLNCSVFRLVLNYSINKNFLTMLHISKWTIRECHKILVTSKANIQCILVADSVLLKYKLNVRVSSSKILLTRMLTSFLNTTSEHPNCAKQELGK